MHSDFHAIRIVFRLFSFQIFTLLPHWPKMTVPSPHSPAYKGHTTSRQLLSHVNYGISTWGFKLDTRISKLQKRAVRAITNSKYNCHTTPLFKQLDLLKANDIFKLSCFKLLYKYENDNLPIYFNGMFVTHQNMPERTRRTTRLPQRFRDVGNNTTNNNVCNIQIKHTNTIFCRLCIRHEIPKLLQDNVLPRDVIVKIYSHSYKSFTDYAKKHIIQNYQPVCDIRNCFICKRNGIAPNA